jgi:hypothetical protein
VTLWPLVDVVLFGSLAAFVGTNGTSGASKASGYLLAGIVLWHVIYQSQIAMSTGLLEETWTRNLLNLMVTPIREVEFVAGVAMFGMVKLAMGVGVMVLGALAFFSTWSGFGLIPIAITLPIVGWAISFVMGLVLRFAPRRGAGGGDVRAVPPVGAHPDRRATAVMQPLALACRRRMRSWFGAWSTLARQLDRSRDRRDRVGRRAPARGLVPRPDAQDLPQARLHHALHMRKPPAAVPGAFSDPWSSVTR